MVLLSWSDADEPFEVSSCEDELYSASPASTQVIFIWRFTMKNVRYSVIDNFNKAFEV